MGIRGGAPVLPPPRLPATRYCKAGAGPLSTPPQKIAMVKGGGFKRTSRARKKLAFRKNPVKGIKAYKRNAAKLAKRIVKRELNRNIETKQSVSTSTDGVEVFHNNFITLDNALLATTQGVQDPMAGNTNNRIGDKITLRGIKLKGMVELNERYSDVTIRILVVRAAKGDVPTRATLFNGVSGNKMLDTINTERYSIIASRYMKLKAPNSTASTSDGTSTQVSLLAQPAGIYYGPGISGTIISRSTKIWKIWIPGKKFKKNGVITYEDGSSQVKFFDYHVLMYAYSNISTAQDVWYVARNNDYIKQMYFKDA